MRNTFLIVALALVATTILALVVGGYSGVISARDGTLVASLVSASALALVVGGSAVRSYRGQGGRVLVHLAIWGAICLALALVYRWKQPLSAALGLA